MINKKAAFAVMLIILAVFTLALNSCAKDGISPDETAKPVTPALYINGSLYIYDETGSCGKAELLPDEYKLSGTVEFICPSSEFPDEELEAHGLTVGDEIYSSDDNSYGLYVVVDGELYHFLRASVVTGGVTSAK